MKTKEMTLGTVATYINGRAFKPSEWESKGLPIIRIQNLTDSSVSYNYSQATYEEKYLVKNGDLLFAWSASLGAHIWKREDAWLNQHIFKVIPNDGIDKMYLFYFLQKITAELYAKAHGTGMVHITKAPFMSTPIQVPSIEKQKEIVTHIEELFSQLDSGVETLKKTKQQLEVYRQAVLKEVFGKLTSCVPMGDIATMIDPQPSHRTPPECVNGIPYIGIGDIDYKDKIIQFDEARKVGRYILEEHKNRYTLRDGDFIMGKIGTIGKPFRVILPQDYALSANVILIQPDSETIDPEFLFWQFTSPLVTEQLMEGKNETSQPAFGIQKARLIKINTCSKEMQLQIVASIKEKLSVCDSIARTTEVALRQAEAMRQSILKQAFEGSD